MMNEKSYPTLYKLDANGAVIKWDIRVEWCEPPIGISVPVIVASWGREGGQFQETREVVTHGKNAGKKNATTPFEQACKDAKSKWEKQQKAQKYSTSREAALKGEASDLVKGGILPMLAHPRKDKPNALVLPCDTQPKLDGHRCEAEVTITEGDVAVALWSRTRKPINSMPHIVAALKAHFKALDLGPQTVWLDGELYNHDYRDNFEDLTGFITSKTPKEGHEVVQYHVYDIAVADLPWLYRRPWLETLLSNAKGPIILVRTRRASTEEELAAQEEECVIAGYEGLMARNLAAVYEFGKRSEGLLKVKRFQDREFEVVGIKADVRERRDSKGTREVRYAKLVCKLDGWTGPGDEAHEFDASLIGKLAYQATVLAQPEKYVGTLATVKFQGFTEKGKPRFPKARFRVDA